MMEAPTIILFSCTLFSAYLTAATIDTINQHQTFRDGDTIVSPRGDFELGFFSRGSSTNRYLGIWYRKMSYGTIVWVANRETPLNNTSGLVRVSHNGIIVFNNVTGATIWSSNLTRSVKNPIAQLLDTGNLVIRDEHENNAESFIWQSFDFPGDTLLPGMKVGVDLVTGLERYYTSWNSADDPSPGSFTYRLDPNGFPQMVKLKGSVLWSRTGPWIGTQPSGDPTSKPNYIFTHAFVMNKKEIYYTFDLVNKSSPATTRFRLKPNGDSEVLFWNEQSQNWMVYITLIVTDCEHYGLCGAYSCCNINNSPRCECLRGFEPKFPEKWKAADWSDGCVRKTELECGNGDGFMKYSGLKLPDTRDSWYNMSMSLEECKRLCFRNCSCTAYTYTDMRKGGTGCLLWFSELVDTRGYTEDGPDMYVRMAASELGYAERSRRLKRGMEIIFLPVVPTVLLGVLLFAYKKGILKREKMKFSSKRIFPYKNGREDFELPVFSFKTIAKATNNFSENNKLGEGGFGPVYMGILEDGKEIAVKRLSGDSGQGIDEFQNEVLYVAKLQHRNLVALLGCCTGKGERILIYEYMPNKSLDSFIFDEHLRKSLDWSKRYNIVNGIARGLLYLHQDSKLRIIHRDLKPSNILLDHEMNPKISDFGMAKSLGGSQTEEKTKRIVGTYGYMPPEYAIDGLFSIKSDVYSFGVLVIEIISGKKNRLFNDLDHSLNLLGHAWRNYQEEKLLGLIDQVILESSNQNEVFRVIQIALLCVQQYPEDRPSMEYVVLMLTSNIPLPHPKQPGFFTERKVQVEDNVLRKPLVSSSNQLTVTALEPRL